MAVHWRCCSILAHDPVVLGQFSLIENTENIRSHGFFVDVVILYHILDLKKQVMRS